MDFWIELSRTVNFRKLFRRKMLQLIFKIRQEMGKGGEVERKDKKKGGEKGKANSTWCSQAVTHPSTNHAQCYLTAVIRREPVFSTWYGRWREVACKHIIT